MRHLRKSLLLAAFAALLCGLAAGEEGDEEPDFEGRMGELTAMKDRVVQEVLMAMERQLDEMREGEEEAEPLGRAVRLSFKLLPQENRRESLEVVTATSRYRVNAHGGRDGEGFGLGIFGRLRPLERGGALLLTFEVEFHMEGGGGEVGYETEGSVMLKTGDTKTLAKLGERTLTVTMTDGDEKEF